MNVLVVSDVDLQGEASGAERVLAAHCLGLVKRGHRVSLIAGTRRGGAKAVEEVQGVRVYRYWRSFGSFLGSSRLFRVLSLQAPFDVLMFYQPLSAFGILLVKRSRFIPKVYVSLSPWAEEYAVRAADLGSHIPHLRFQKGGMLLRRIVERFVLRACLRIFVLSQFMVDQLAKEHPGCEDLVTLLPGGVDLERFRPAEDRQVVKKVLQIPPGRPLLLTVRNLEPRMGLDHLLYAMRSLQEEQTAPFLIIGGKGPIEGRLRDLAKRLSLDRSVRFEGYIPEERLPIYYQGADFFVLPTKALEGFGLVAVEALACGTPVLGTPVGAIPEVLGGLEAELVFQGSDPRTLALGIIAHIKKAHADPESYDALRHRCRAYASAYFGWEVIIDQLEQALIKLIGSP